MRVAPAALLAVLFLAGGAAARRRPVLPGAWRTVATAQDRARLRGWRDTWLEALGLSRAAGAGAAIAAEGPLFDPDRTLPRSTPPSGTYRCRLFMIGAHKALREFAPVPPFPCTVESDGVTFRFIRPGAQQVVGRLYPDGPRAVFLGTLEFADERRLPRYGRDAGRDVAGLVERVDERRWRLTLPRPRFEAVLEVVEIVPAS